MSKIKGSPNGRVGAKLALIGFQFFSKFPINIEQLWVRFAKNTFFSANRSLAAGIA
jgi:hypothetical protein